MVTTPPKDRTWKLWVRDPGARHYYHTTKKGGEPRRQQMASYTLVSYPEFPGPIVGYENICGLSPHSRVRVINEGI